MRTFTKEQLVENLENLSGANLSDADLSDADLSGADLRCVDLSGADMSGADLRCANLSGVDLSDADLSGANLSGADLSGANLSDADLSGANLSGANLSGADLSGANLRFLHSANGKELACMNAGKYQVVLSKEKIAIGCKFFTVEEWKEFDDDKISKMDDGALEWWKQWKELVFMFHKNIFC